MKQNPRENEVATMKNENLIEINTKKNEILHETAAMAE